MRYDISLPIKTVCPTSADFPAHTGNQERDQNAFRKLSHTKTTSMFRGFRGNWDRYNLTCRLLYRAWRYRWKIERAEIQFLRKTIQRGQTVVDIGAHKGAVTYWMQRAVGHWGQVIAFEPQIELADYLLRISQALRMDQVTVINCAISSQSGIKTIARPIGKPWPSAKITDQKQQQEEIIPVEAQTLDDFFLKHSGRPVHFIKCDVEVHEYSVFRGGMRILQEDRPTLLFECERQHHSGQGIDHVFQLLESLGYKGYFFSKPHGNLRPLCELCETQLENPQSKSYTRNFAFLPK